MKTFNTKKVLAVAVAIIILTAAVSGIIGYVAGKNHVITNQEIWVMEFYPDGAEYDVEIGVELDGNWYVYDGYIG